VTQQNPQRIRDSLIGTVLVGEGQTRFHLRTLLGEGGQGWVFKANYDDPEGFWIVVKILRPEGVTSESLERFARETKVLQMLGAASVPNPNIVRFYDHGVHSLRLYGSEHAMPFIALEYVDGPTLARVIDEQAGTGIPIDRSIRLMKQVARALATVHGRRIVHRDLKPSNILLATVDGREVAKVTDFGLVKAPDLSPRATATIAGASLGYAPPEQYEMGNARVSAQTDVFSFAAILFELLSGRGAFPHNPGDSPLRIVARMLSGERPQLAKVQASLPPELRDRADVIAALDREMARATAPDPSHRHGTINGLWDTVEPILRSVARPSRALEIVDDPSRRSLPEEHGTAPLVWRVAGGPLDRDRLRAAVVIPEEGAAYAVGMQGVYRWYHGYWAPFAVPPSVDIRNVRGVARSRAGEIVLYGEAGLAVTLAQNGVVRPLAAAQPDYNWLGAFTDDGDLVLAGERRSKPVGAVAEIGSTSANVRPVPGTTRLFGVTRLASGELLACGAHGDLVQISSQGTSPGHRDVAWGRSGHLYSVARTAQGGAFAVGSGGHALALTVGSGVGEQGVGELSAALEAVQTTRDLWCVRIDPAGVAWAAGSQARLLERRAGVWERVPIEGPSGHFITVSPQGSLVLVVSEDGTVLEGTPGR
jgi:serine/threonine protein kinase